jgi:Zn-dependent protease
MRIFNPTALQVGSFFGIPVKMHWSFSFFFVWIGIAGYWEGLRNFELIRFFVLAILLFICVVLHEYGHALAARRFGVKTRDILLTPIGGIARLESMPPKPIQEFIIAIAGPLVNIFIAAALSLLFFSDSFVNQVDLVFSSSSFGPVLGSNGGILPLLLFMNLTLFAFNMIPAYPMDGGRVLRSFFSVFMNRHRATIWAARIGQIIGLTFVALAIFNIRFLILGLIGLFIIFTAGVESKMVGFEERLKKSTVNDFLLNHIGLLHPQLQPSDSFTYTIQGTASLYDLYRLYQQGNYKPIGIMNNIEIIGYLPYEAFRKKVDGQ